MTHGRRLSVHSILSIRTAVAGVVRGHASCSRLLPPPRSSKVFFCRVIQQNSHPAGERELLFHCKTHKLHLELKKSTQFSLGSDMQYWHMSNFALNNRKVVQKMNMCTPNSASVCVREQFPRARVSSSVMMMCTACVCCDDCCRMKRRRHPVLQCKEPTGACRAGNVDACVVCCLPGCLVQLLPVISRLHHHRCHSVTARVAAGP